MDLKKRFFYFARVLILSIFLFLNSSKSAWANCNINMTDWSESQVRACLTSGGTIGLVATDGVYGEYYSKTVSIIRDFNDGKDNDEKMTVEVRIFNGNSTPTTEQVTAVIAIMSDPTNDLGVPTMIRVNNEPFDTYTNSNYSYEQRLEDTVQAQYQALQLIRESGSNIYLASEMIDLHNQEFGKNVFQIWDDMTNYITEHSNDFPGINSYHDLYDIYSINGYFTPGNFGVFPTINEDGSNVTLAQVLGNLPAGKTWRFSEFGYIGNGPEYGDVSKMIQNLTDLAVFFANPNNKDYFETFAGFNIFTNDPHGGTSSNMSAILAAIESLDLGSIFEVLDASFVRDEAAYNQWLEDLIASGFLVVCCRDGEGTCAKDDVEKFLGYAAPGQCNSDFAMAETGDNVCMVIGKEVEDGTLRPKPCHHCTANVPGATDSCVVAPILKKEVDWSCSLNQQGCDDYVKEIDFNISVQIDTADTLVPFAGYHEVIKEDGRSKNLNNYLADYITGTAFYDEEIYDPTDIEDQRNMINELGVFRKLAPKQLQDELKMEMIDRGYNYEIKGYYIKNVDKLNQGEKPKFEEITIKMQEFEDHLPPQIEDFDTKAEYDKEFIDWAESKWGQMWKSVPMFTREDAPGAVEFEIEHDPGTLDPGESGLTVSEYRSKFPMAVPHLGRLYEASSELDQLLMPTKEDQGIGGETSLVKNNGPIIAQDSVSFAELISEDEIKTENVFADNIETGEVLGDSNQISCKFENNISTTECEVEEKLEDYNPNDEVCCNSDFSVNVANIVIPKEEYESKCPPECKKWAYCDFIGGQRICSGESSTYQSGMTCVEREEAGGTVTVERKIDVDLKLPYLDEIWTNMASTTGFLNIFKPAVNHEYETAIEEFPEKYGVSNINYKVISDSGVSINPSYGELYFPYLGGLQQAKKCISEQLLTPSHLQMKGNVDLCDFGEDSSINDSLAYQASCSNEMSLADLKERGINPDLENKVNAAAIESNVDPEILYAILRNESGYKYFNNPNISTCEVSGCGAIGPMQILNGAERVNCNPNRGEICADFCSNGEFVGNPGSFETWETYDCTGDICSLEDSLACAGKILRGKGGISSGEHFGLDNKTALYKAFKGYLGGSCDTESCCKDSGDHFSFYCNRTYCYNALWFLGLTPDEE